MFLDNKYNKWYRKITQNAKERFLKSTVYVETHHIIPKSIGGQDDSENLVKLTAREHFRKRNKYKLEVGKKPCEIGYGFIEKEMQ